MMGMQYMCEFEKGRELSVEEDGDQTLVSISSRDPGQQQSQGTGFTIGRWSSPPEAYRTGKAVIIQLHTTEGDKFLGMEGGRARRLDDQPELSTAERVELTKSSSGSSSRIERMKPMEPMRGMRPMEPMKMEMGSMKMSMGFGEDSPKGRFCTQCGAALREQDHFCGRCGAKVG